METVRQKRDRLAQVVWVIVVPAKKHSSRDNYKLHGYTVNSVSGTASCHSERSEESRSFANALR